MLTSGSGVGTVAVWLSFVDETSFGCDGSPDDEQPASKAKLNKTDNIFFILTTFYFSQAFLALLSWANPMYERIISIITKKK